MITFILTIVASMVLVRQLRKIWAYVWLIIPPLLNILYNFIKIWYKHISSVFNLIKKDVIAKGLSEMEDNGVAIVD